MKKMNRTKTWIPVLAVAALLVAPTSVLNASTSTPSIPEQVRHDLVMLPFYNVFDNFTYQVNGSTVTLGGQVTFPTLKSQAEAVVKTIPGVTAVKNDIQVLPLSRFDNQIRWAELRAIYGNSALFRYNLVPIPPIHIVVDNGNVTLDGVVANKMDKDIAGIAANSVPNVFSVTNNLQVRSS